VWSKRRPKATVIWFAGSNPQKIMDGYSAYNTSKMAVLKLVEQLDHETPDCKFVAFGPGYAKTKIHDATLKANWPNERIARGDDGNSMEDIYKAMMWCVRQEKEVVGGRNICVSDLATAGHLRSWPNLYKLRRNEYFGAGPLG
jgi:NAD(P)-dependent dehydrogenase (short-subunit alcohol dehydrogenase family)